MINYNIMNYSEKDINRFWSKVNIVYKDDGIPNSDVCWEWDAGKFKNYGRFQFNGKSLSSHRFIYECFNGPILDNLCTLHKCDNPPCVNPYHLFLGTYQDNINDKVNKGRQAKGEIINTAILTEVQVEQMVISGIKQNKTWKHIK